MYAIFQSGGHQYVAAENDVVRIEKIEAQAGQQITFDQVTEAARQGEAIALAALQEVGNYLGIGIANLMNIFNPQMVVLGGALNSASDILLPIVEQVVAATALKVISEDVRIIPSAHGTEACVMGAVALVLDDILRESAFA